MTEARIVVEPGTIRPGHAGPATGDIWLSLGQTAFPRAGWNDFVVVVLGWWSKAVLQLLRGVRVREAVNFMDGPYLAELSSELRNEWRLQLFETGRTKRLVGQETIDPRALIDSIISASESVLVACRQNAGWSADADILADLESSLRKEVDAGTLT